MVVNVLTFPSRLMLIAQLPEQIMLGLVIVLPLPVTFKVMVQLSWPTMEPPDQELEAPESITII